MASNIRVLIITGYGLNCEDESRHAWELAGAKPSLVHLSDLLENPAQLADYGALMFIGGFSFGDHMGSGLVFANRARHGLQEQLQKFIDAQKLILGVCNGFQIITKLGLLPGLDSSHFTPRVALMQNDCGAFQNRWVTLTFDQQSPCVFTRGLRSMPMPVRHGEGKLVTADADLMHRLEAEHCVACKYADPRTGEPTMEFPLNPNGPLHAAAGLCDPTGRIFGLMPHPEAYLYPENHPTWELQRLRAELPEKGLGLRLFENAVSFLRG